MGAGRDILNYLNDFGTGLIGEKDHYVHCLVSCRMVGECDHSSTIEAFAGYVWELKNFPLLSPSIWRRYVQDAADDLSANSFGRAAAGTLGKTCHEACIEKYPLKQLPRQ